MLSKPLRPPFIEQPCLPKEETPVAEPPVLTYTTYFKESICLKSYKLPELKQVAKYYGLRLTGSKPLIIERIIEHYNKEQYARKIQKLFRGNIVRHMLRLRGDAFYNRKLCVNDSDFVTLEPLNEIEDKDFFSYTDSKSFIYGFSLTSLIQCMSSQSKLTNPYNRENMNGKITNNIKSLYAINKIVFADKTLPIKNKSKPYEKYRQSRTRSQTDSLRNQLHQTNRAPASFNELFNVATQPYANSPSDMDHTLYMSLYLNRNYVLTDDSRPRLNRITTSRQNSIGKRTQDLFMEIDFLGNYTQSTWFINLQHRDYIRFYRCICEIWNYRGQISSETKMNICPFFTNPMASMISMHSNSIYECSIEQVQSICLGVMENLIYSGVDEEYRKLGALHVLSALTIVSPQARMAMPWLYESLTL